MSKPKTPTPRNLIEPAHPTAAGAIDDLPLDVLRANAVQAAALIQQARALLPGLFLLTDEDRKHSDGRLRDGEDDALLAILDVADARPASFNVLADKDSGRDRETFETALLRERLQRRAALAELAAELEPFAQELSDTLLVLGSFARVSTLAAYGIAKPLAQYDTDVRTKLAPALSFYGNLALRAAKARAAKKTK